MQRVYTQSIADVCQPAGYMLVAAVKRKHYIM